jgi:membrane-bound lytic murein transglycosylase A
MGLSEAQFNRAVRKQFRIYRAAGHEGSNKVLFTGYYAPVFDAGLTRSRKFKYPLYKSPDDLVRIDLSQFNDKFKGERIIARVNGNQVLPYYTRRQIEIEKVLNGKHLEIAWLKDPMDVYLLHIEGAGRLRLPDGSMMNVNYAASNGRPYRSFGRYLLNKGYLTSGDLSVQKIRRYLSKNPKVFNEILSHNDSYAFFKKVKYGPLGNINVPLTVGRSLALDAKLFPKGALAFISSRKPTINRQGRITGWRDFSRFVLNQDTGSAIKGAGRADLFWGSGPGAGIAAWNHKHDGDLYVLIKKR